MKPIPTPYRREETPIVLPGGKNLIILVAAILGVAVLAIAVSNMGGNVNFNPNPIPDLPKGPVPVITPTPTPADTPVPTKMETPATAKKTKTILINSETEIPPFDKMERGVLYQYKLPGGSTVDYDGVLLLKRHEVSNIEIETDVATIVNMNVGNDGHNDGWIYGDIVVKKAPSTMGISGMLFGKDGHPVGASCMRKIEIMKGETIKKNELIFNINKKVMPEITDVILSIDTKVK